MIRVLTCLLAASLGISNWAWGQTKELETPGPFASPHLLSVRLEKTTEYGFPLPLTSRIFDSERDTLAVLNKPVEKGFNGDMPPSTPQQRPLATPLAPPSRVSLPGHRNTGFVDLNYYWDTRAFTVFTINAGAKLPNDFEYFQFLNAFSPFESNETDWHAYYTEINLRRPIRKDSHYLKPFDWTIQYADGTFADSVGRAGVRWRVHDTPGELGRFVNETLKLRLGVSFHLLETDGTGCQLEYAYRRDFCNKRVYIGGFLDHNLDEGNRSTWVTENQIGLRLFDQWHAVAEYRYSDFSPKRFRSGVGLGLEYVIRFK